VGGVPVLPGAVQVRVVLRAEQGDHHGVGVAAG